MRRAVFRRSTTGMALFPFLAVLICTMGSLIVLLVLVLQQSRVQADVARSQLKPTPVAQRSTERQEAEQQHARQLAQELEDQQWRREMLEAQRAEQLENLQRQRQELSHLEDHLRRLEDQWKQLQSQAQELARLEQRKTADEQTRAEELDQLKAQIDAKKKEVDEARKKLAARPQAYSLVPYIGKSGTKRRPIYIECSEEGIVLHPENVVFLPADFQGPLGPGNPLDAALRTVREHWARQPEANREGEPYPLLIVRPNGAVAYSLARTAMKSWEEEFGYELIEEDMKLEFPPPDPELEAQLARTLKDARSRQAILAASMPSRYKGAGGDAVAAAPEGGFRATPYADEGGPPTGGAPGGAPGGSTRRSAGPGSGLGGGMGTGDRTAGGGSGASGGARSGPAGAANRGFGFGAGTDTAGSTAGTTGGGMNLSAGGGVPGQGGTGGHGFGTGGTARGTPGGASSSSVAGGEPGIPGGGDGGGAGAGAADATQRAAANGSGGTAGPGGNRSVGSSQGSGGGGGGNMAGPNLAGGAAGFGSAGGATMPTADGGQTGNGAAGGDSATGASGKSGGGGGGNSGVSASGTSDPNGSGGASLTLTPQNAARRGGRDWAIRNKTQAATGITRPIRVRCQVDRLIIIPERGDDQRQQVIPLQGDVQASLDPFITAIWRQTDRWGLAVANGYWKPILHVEVAPGAEGNFQQLQTLLQGSGLDIIRR